MPLQPPTLAAFPPWGNSEGAGCMTLTAAKVKYIVYKTQVIHQYLRI